MSASAQTAEIKIPDKLVPVFEGEADVRGAHGGRGSAKSRTFAKMSAVRAHMWDAAGRTGIILCGRQFQNSLDDSSLEEIKAAIREEDWLLPHFDIGEKYVRTASGRIAYTFSGLDRNINSIKGKSRILLAWIEEAEPVTEEAWTKLIPTLREEDSELWVTWNPEDEASPTNKRFFNSSDPRTKIVEMNWRDNPWFPQKLERERKKDFEERPHLYPHIWEGEFLEAVEGAYFAKVLAKAREEGRIGNVAADPLMSLRAYCDLGGTGAKADAFSIWVCQFVGREIRVLDHYEASGQPIAEHLAWMRSRGYDEGKISIFLPHDGLSESGPTPGSWESAFRSAGYSVQTLRMEGSGRTGARSVRIEAVRRLFPRIWIDDARCAQGVKALGWYHEKRDEKRRMGLGPNHDWSSHSADAFGLMCVHYSEPKVGTPAKAPPRPKGPTGWMG